MHSLEIYSIRVFDKALNGPRDKRYADLDNIRGRNCLDIYQESFKEVAEELFDLKEVIKRKNPGRDVKNVKNRLFRCSENLKSDSGDEIYGCLDVGEYGIHNDIIDRFTGGKTGDVGVDESVIRKHFFYIKIKPGMKKGLLFIQAIGGKGAKTLFEEIIQPNFFKRTGGLICQVRPLAHKRVVGEWYKNALVKEIKLSKFTDSETLKDISDRLGDVYTEVAFKPKLRTGKLGRLSDIEDDLVEIVKDRTESIKAKLSYNGRDRVFQLGVKDEPVSSIEIEEFNDDIDVKFVGGNPVHNSLLIYTRLLSDEMWPNLVIHGG